VNKGPIDLAKAVNIEKRNHGSVFDLREMHLCDFLSYTYCAYRGTPDKR
jgi:hypothetical protein